MTPVSRRSSWIIAIENAWDSTRLRRSEARPPARFRIEPYVGHGSAEGVVVRGRVLDNPPPSDAVEGERVTAVLRRRLSNFVTTELPGVPLRITLAGTSIETVTDDEGYFLVRFAADTGELNSPWTTATVERVGEYRGLTDSFETPVEVLVPPTEARFGVVSDIDDTILRTGVQNVRHMVRRTFLGSAVTRTPFTGAAELYQDLAAGVNPIFYVSSSPWNLHAFLVAFLSYRGFPPGPVLLRDLLGNAEGREPKHGRIQEILDLHPNLPFVLIGDSGEKDPQIYADIVAANPGRILAVYIREVRLNPADGRVEQVSDAWGHDVPFYLAADSDAIREHATGLGLL